MDPGSSKRPLYAGHAFAEPDWGRIADCICEVLGMIYVRERQTFLRQVKKRGITLEQLAAAAVLEMVRRELSQTSAELN